MSGSLSKRQQARNERTLQDLIKNVPGNSTCADCGTRNPGWASWSLGVFLCMRCAALHRKLGTHISKVKSLSMDSWSVDQVENMKRVGNTISNKIYNPHNTRPPIPFDADEADSAMERFIRQKYKDSETSEREGREDRRTRSSARHDSGSREREERRTRPSARYDTESRERNERRTRQSGRHDTGSIESDDLPPPPPPKTSRFGFRSASSIFPMSSKAKREAAARAYIEENNRDRERERPRSPSPPPRRNKPSRVFGSAVSTESPDMEAKLAQLRDMGFTDEKRNLTVLKGLSGNLEKSIETLVRLGEGSGPSSRSRTPSSAPVLTKRTQERATPTPSSNNPFDMPPPQPQSSQSTGGLAFPNSNTMNGGANITTSNPFGLGQARSQHNLNQQYTLDQSFQNLGISSSQPLFPNHTGGAPRQVFQASAAPPMPSIPQGQYAYGVNQPQSQPQSSSQQSYNPYLQQQVQQPQQTQQSQQPQQHQQPQAFQPCQADGFASNPFGYQRSQTFPLQQQTFYDQPGQQQNNYQHQSQPIQTAPLAQQNLYAQQLHSPVQQLGNPFNQQMQPQQQSQQIPQPQQNQNPYASQTMQAQAPQQQNPYQQFQVQPQQQQQQQQQQQLLPQATGRADKSSIMALYSYPQPASTPMPQLAPQQSEPQAPTQNSYQIQGQGQGQVQNGNNQDSFASPFSMQQQRSVSSPAATFGNGNRNPFTSSGAGSGFHGTGTAVIPSGPRHQSQESMSVEAGGWQGQNGRHSPDAFASLSARSTLR